MYVYVCVCVQCYKFNNICHGRKSNLVEFQILLVEGPVGDSTSRKSDLGDLGIALGSEI